MKNNHPLRWLTQIPLLGELLEFIYCGLLIGSMIWIAYVWRWPIPLLIVVEVVLGTMMLIGYFWVVKKIKPTSEED